MRNKRSYLGMINRISKIAILIVCVLRIAPSVSALEATLSVDKIAARVGEYIIATINAADDKGVDRIMLYHNLAWHEHKCGGLKNCSHSWPITFGVEGSECIYGWAEDTDGNSTFSEPERICVTLKSGGYTLTVQVYDNASGKMIEGASVYLDGDYKGETDTKGELEIQHVAGTHTVTAKTFCLKKGAFQENSCTVNMDQDRTITVPLVCEDDFLTISNEKVEPTEVDSGGVIHISADISDDIGVGEVYFRYGITPPFDKVTNPDWNGKGAKNYHWETDFKMPNNTSGKDEKYTIIIYAKDTAGQQRISEELYVTVHSDGGDEEPPTLSNCSVNPSSGPQGTKFTLRVKAEDNVGVVKVTGRVHLSSSKTDFVTMSLDTGDSKSGYWEGTYDSLDTEAGEYDVDFYALDQAGNDTIGCTTSLTVNELPSDRSNVEVVVGFCDTPTHEVYVAGGYAYVAEGSWGGLRVIDVSDPTNPHEVGFCDTPNSAVGVHVAGGYAYVACGLAGLRVIDISDPTNPHEVGFCDTPSSAAGVHVARGYAYVACGLAGLRVVDISDPANPHEVGFYDTSGGLKGFGGAKGVHVAGGCAYVACEWAGLRVVDISNPSNPQEVGFYGPPVCASGVHVVEGYAYVADACFIAGNHSLYILRYTGAPDDTTPPATVSDLRVTIATASSITLSWTAPGDDGDVGTATTYDIRYSTEMIDDTNFHLASQVQNEPVPEPAGTEQTCTVSNLSPGEYYFAMKTADEAPNWSELSNVVIAQTESGVTRVGNMIIKADNFSALGGGLFKGEGNVEIYGFPHFPGTEFFSLGVAGTITFDIETSQITSYSSVELGLNALGKFYPILDVLSLSFSATDGSISMKSATLSLVPPYGQMQLAGNFDVDMDDRKTTCSVKINDPKWPELLKLGEFEAAWDWNLDWPVISFGLLESDVELGPVVLLKIGFTMSIDPNEGVFIIGLSAKGLEIKDTGGAFGFSLIPPVKGKIPIPTGKIKIDTKSERHFL